MIVALPLLACDDATGLGDPLTEEETLALLEVLIGQGLESSFANFSSAQAPAVAAALVPFTVDEKFTADVPCPLGGSVSLNASIHGSGDTETGNADVTVSLLQVHHGCVVEHDKTGLVFTLNGDPNVQFQSDLTVRNQSDLDVKGGITGRIRWATNDERSGSCPIDLDYDLSLKASAESGTASVVGDICGIHVSKNVTIGES